MMNQNWKTVLAVAGAAATGAAVIKLVLRNSRRISIRNKTVLITGGSRGLGLLLGREFAERGGRVPICARSKRELERVRQEFADVGRSILALSCDVGVRAEICRVVEAVRSELGEVDILVNNAGTILVGPAEN